MQKTILPKKAGFENPMALDDEHHQSLASDPSIPQFPQGSTFGTSQQGGFGMPASYNSTPNSTQSYSPMGNGYQQQNSNVQIVQNQAESLKNTGGAMQEGADVLVKNDNTDWINKKWRPAMGWLYMLTCFFDFVVFPVLWSVLQAMSKGQVTSQWQPLTLQGAGLYHIAMGAVLGIAAYGRTKEKLESKQ